MTMKPLPPPRALSRGRLRTLTRGVGRPRAPHPLALTRSLRNRPMKFALKLSVAGFVCLLVLAAYAQEEKAVEPVKDVEGVIRRVIEGVKPGAPGSTKPGEKKTEEEAVE